MSRQPGQSEIFKITPRRIAPRRFDSFLAAFAVTLFMAGCGMPSAPSAPSLKLPDPATDLTAARVGDQVTLKWTMPKRSTDKLMLRGPQRAEVLRTQKPGSALAVAELTFDPAIDATYTDKLPPELTSGALRELIYVVKLQNHAGQAAASSNVAYTAAGAAPEPLSGLSATARPEGVVLRWSGVPGDQGGSGAETLIRIHRTLEGGAPAAKKSADTDQSGQTGQVRQFGQMDKEAQEQNLVVRQGASPGSAVDATAIPNREYSYVAERAFAATFDSHAVEVAGVSSSSIEVDTKDIFPPKPPEDLAAIAVREQNAIDLSWTPDTEADLAGYAVYRREGQGAWTRISSQAVVLAPEFRDTGVEHTHSYSYAVTAIDRSGNESARGAVSEETLP